MGELEDILKKRDFIRKKFEEWGYLFNGNTPQLYPDPINTNKRQRLCLYVETDLNFDLLIESIYRSYLESELSAELGCLVSAKNKENISKYAEKEKFIPLNASIESIQKIFGENTQFNNDRSRMEDMIYPISDKEDLKEMKKQIALEKSKKNKAPTAPPSPSVTLASPWMKSPCAARTPSAQQDLIRPLGNSSFSI